MRDSLISGPSLPKYLSRGFSRRDRDSSKGELQTSSTRMTSHEFLCSIDLNWFGSTEGALVILLFGVSTAKGDFGLISVRFRGDASGRVTFSKHIKGEMERFSHL